MTVYRILRRLARVALGWYYADVVIEGHGRLPASGPTLIVANHPNALVDAMVVAVAVRRRVLLTAKATLFEQPALAALLRVVGVVPLRRARDEQAVASDAASSVSRNADAFRMVTSALAEGSVVLVFPEGISHDAPALAPLRTGAARMALMAHASGVSALRIVAVGLVYEAKEQPRSRVLVRTGEPLDLDAWLMAHTGDAAALTAEIDARLRRVTLNFGSSTRARRAEDLARTLGAVAGELTPLAHPPSLGPEADLARRIEAAGEALAAASETTVRQADAFAARVHAFERKLASRGVALSELRVSPRLRHGAQFVLRESLLLALALPVALIDRLAHDLPVRLARALAQKSLASDPSRDQPAMRTIVLATGLLLTWYLLLGLLLADWFGIGIALLVLAMLALSASAELALRDRVSRAWRRARTYLALRADPAFQSSAIAEANRLLEEARALERALMVAQPATPTAH
jgi:glycerol-3-phosphate O-acyltransferase / dihydroxyacetone phosphate acyltransferase